MLYDVTMALAAFRNAFSRHTIAVWADNTHVVEHLRGQGLLIRMAKEHWRKIAVAGACVLLAWMLVQAGMVPGFNLAMPLFAISTIVLGVIANFVFELLKNRRRKRSSRIT
jgi:hypothetical protein